MQYCTFTLHSIALRLGGPLWGCLSPHAHADADADADNDATADAGVVATAEADVTTADTGVKAPGVATAATLLRVLRRMIASHDTAPDPAAADYSGAAATTAQTSVAAAFVEARGWRALELLRDTKTDVVAEVDTSEKAEIVHLYQELAQLCALL